MGSAWTTGSSPVVTKKNAPRDRFSASSLPDLIGIPCGREARLTVRFGKRLLSMDHRVIGERSDAVLQTAMPGGDEQKASLFDI